MSKTRSKDHVHFSQNHFNNSQHGSHKTHNMPELKSCQHRITQLKSCNCRAITIRLTNKLSLDSSNSLYYNHQSITLHYTHNSPIQALWVNEERKKV